jgi:hypothetical protein
LLLVGALVLGAAIPVLGQGANPAAAAPAEPAAASAPAEAPRVDRSHVRQVYRLVERWARGAAVDSRVKPEPLWVGDAAGVCVTLRWMGRTMGVGEAVAPMSASAAGPAGLPAVVDLAELAQTATLLALSDVESRLSEARDRAAQAASQPAVGTALSLADLAGGGELLVDVQVARRPEDIALPAGADPEALANGFACGYHGLVMTRTGKDGKAERAWLWPGNSLAKNMSQNDQLLLLLRRLGPAVTPADVDRRLGQIARPGGPALARFEVLHLVRPDRDAPVAELVRGNVPVPADEFGARTLDAMADRLTQGLLRRLRADGSMTGTYYPGPNRWDPETAAPVEEAMAAYALARRAGWQRGRDADGSAAGTPALDGLRRSVKYLSAALLDNPRRPSDPVAAALTLMALCEGPGLPEFKDQRDRLGQLLLGLQNPSGALRSGPDAGAEALRQPGQVLAVAALASLYEQTRDPGLRAAVDRGQAWIWSPGQAGQLGATRPWIAYLAFRMHRLADPADAAAADVPAWAAQARALEAMRAEVLSRQVTAAPALGPADVLGGFDPRLSVKPEPGAPILPMPNYRSAYDLVFLAVTLREAPPAERSEALLRLAPCAGAARFLAQLMFDEPSCYYVIFKGEALGGVRTSLADDSLGALPAAAALLATVELQAALDALAAGPQ